MIGRSNDNMSSSSRLIYSVRGLERSELGGSHGCPGRLWNRLGSHEIRPIHSALSLGQSIPNLSACNNFSRNTIL